MNIDAANRLAATEKVLAAELEKLLAKLDDEDKALLLASQETWNGYRNTFSTLEANDAKGGSIHSMLYGKAAEAMTRNRIVEIRECLRQDGLQGKPKRRRRPR